MDEQGKTMKKDLQKKLQGPLTNKQWKYFKSLCEHQKIDLDETALTVTSPFMLARHWFHIGWRAKKTLKQQKKLGAKHGS